MIDLEVALAEEKVKTTAGPLFRSNARHLARGPRRQNLYRSDGTARIWYRLVYEDCMRLDLEECFDADSVEGIGSRPTWIEEETCNAGVDFFSGYYGKAWEKFGLEMGIAPKQPFAVEHSSPRYYNGGYYEDADVDYNWEVAQIWPLAPEHAASRWERYFSQQELYDRELALERARNFQLASQKVRYMFIRWDRHGDCNPWDKGIRVALYSSYDFWERFKHKKYLHLAAGSDHGGDRAKAWEALLEDVHKNEIRVTAAELRDIEAKATVGWRRLMRAW